ncbi:MAG TPA: DUF58 domain-containing protein [Gemmatimonadaceae bacterium]|nr:DUF58 domain-containing protein [Gemmatimonadaceae bacterium]
MTQPTGVLDPAVLARIGHLELIARVVVEGFINGLHRSPHLGASTDFAEHRAYMPGDDLRRMDWRLFARSDRYFIKEFEAETNTNFMVLLDVSPSMYYAGGGGGGGGGGGSGSGSGSGSGGGGRGAGGAAGSADGDARLSKVQYACYLAAALAWFSSGQRDRVGLATFDRDIVDFVPCSAKHLQLVLHALDRASHAEPPGAPTGAGQAVAGAAARAEAGSRRPTDARLAGPLRKLSESLRRRSIVLLISDFYEEPGDVLDALSYLRGHGNDVLVFHVLDRDELQFPFADATNFVDLESGERMPVVADYLRTQYRELVSAHVAELERRVREQRMDYALFNTSRPLDQALFTYLLARQRLARVR